MFIKNTKKNTETYKKKKCNIKTMSYLCTCTSNEKMTDRSDRSDQVSPPPRNIESKLKRVNKIRSDQIILYYIILLYHISV
jgi:hypothetical protein